MCKHDTITLKYVFEHFIAIKVIVKELPELEVRKKGRYVYFSFKMTLVLPWSCLKAVPSLSTHIIFSKAVKIMRRLMLDHNNLIDGTYNIDSIDEIVPPFCCSLLAWLSMALILTLN